MYFSKEIREGSYKGPDARRASSCRLWRLNRRFPVSLYLVSSGISSLSAKFSD